MRSLLFLTFFCLQVSAFSQKNSTIILGTRAVNSNASIDVTEVTIQEYCFFIINHDFDPSLFPNPEKLSASARIYFQDFLKGENSSFIKVMKNYPVFVASYGEKGFEVTKEYKAYLKTDSTGFTIFNPVVGISFEQAQGFCSWRQENENRNRIVKIHISLPPKELYQSINENTDSVIIRRNYCDRFQYNFAHPPCVSLYKNKDMFQQGIGLVRVDRFEPNSKKLYNVQGNAAEMTSIKGIAVGGSFKHSARESMNDQVQHYNQEENWLGFRCYVTVQ